MQSGRPELNDMPLEPLGSPVNRPSTPPAEVWHPSKDHPGFEECDGKLRSRDTTIPCGLLWTTG